jgi:hypothetical protein
MANYFDQEGYGSGALGPFVNTAREDTFSNAIGLAPARNSEMMGEMAAIGAQGFAQREQAKLMAEAYKAANKQRSGSGIGGILGGLASTVGGAFLGPVAGAAGKALTKGLFG